MEELSYSFHIGSDKNKKNSVRLTSKNNVSGTNSMSNNAIQNAKQLSTADKHNYRKYDNRQDEIVVIKGTTSLYNDVLHFYKNEFEEARLEYNNKQTRDDRKIDDYFKKISNNSKSDLAVQIIIELGNKKFWDTKSMTYKHKMTNVFIEQVDDLELLLPNFKICSAIIHYDETSPHLHIVGVPIKYNCKTGMSMQVGKTDVFTRNSLKELQDKMRILCIEEYNKEYNLDATLKKKLKGRNKDIHVSDMINYQDTKDLIEKNQKEIDTISRNSLELKSTSNNIKNEIGRLKKVPLKNDLFLIAKEQKDKLENYIDKVDKTTDKYKNVKKLSANLNIIAKQARQDSKKIKNLQENNAALELRVDNLTSKVNEQQEKINELRQDNFNLKYKLQQLEELFKNLINLFKRMIKKVKKSEVYLEVLNDMHDNRIINKDTLDGILNNKNNTKEKDDFEL
ncbi:MAG: plasmid recombination protein [Clostridia bacterium]|nr:plasmid recombination protein [Clostridia bacterium]